MATAGMYLVGTEGHKEVVIGDYTICRQDENSIWIQHADGEGAQFSDELFEAAIAQFYDQNF